MALESSLTLPGRTAARLAKVIEVAVAEAELSLPQYRLLAFLAEGSAAATALAGRLAVSRPSITGLVDGLVARDLVERGHDTDDRRRVTHALTIDGRQALAAADAAVEQRLRRLADHLEPDRRYEAIEGLAAWAEAIDSAVTAKLAVANQ